MKKEVEGQSGAQRNVCPKFNGEANEFEECGV